MKARVSFRISPFLWMNEERQNDLVAWMKKYKNAVEEIAFFTAFTHPPLPLKTMQHRAKLLEAAVPRFKALGIRVGINHLATVGHLDENPENSLSEPWQHLVDMDGSVSKSCYCTMDPAFQDYVTQVYVALSRSNPEFIWVDDDVRMESHGAAIKYGCFCKYCLEAFCRQVGRNYTREELHKAFMTGSYEERLTLRRQLLEHHRLYIRDLLALIRSAVDTVNPKIQLGLMTGETTYSGIGFPEWTEAMAGKNQVEVKWRPGGGFYTDDQPCGIFWKAHSIGRQTGLLPKSVVDVQSEHENFPYQRIKKSVTCFQTEIAAYIGAGCTGTALNCMGISSDPIEEYRPYFEAVKSCRGFFDKAVQTFGRSECEGLWTAFTKDHVATLSLDKGEWPTGAFGGGLGICGELSEIGLPTAYTAAGAKIALLAGDTPYAFSKQELRRMLAGSVLMDGGALHCLNQMGLGEYTGFTIKKRKDHDTTEVFTDDPINGKFSGWHRDCRPSFWPDACYLILPSSNNSRVLATLQDFTPTDFGPSSGVFENVLGGRVAILGYTAWKMVHTLGKTSQLKSLCRWLSHDRMPAYVASYSKAGLWCRRDSKGNPAILLLNSTIDTINDMQLNIRDVPGNLVMTRMNGKTERLVSKQMDAPYSVFKLPKLATWEPVLIASK